VCCSVKFKVGECRLCFSFALSLTNSVSDKQLHCHAVKGILRMVFFKVLLSRSVDLFLTPFVSDKQRDNVAVC